jgi:hypothetical protein
VEEDHKTERPAAKATESQTIRSVGENRWLVARSEVDRARANLSQVLKSARLEPKVVNGRTEGFLVRMIRPRSLLEKLGLKRGGSGQGSQRSRAEQPGKGVAGLSATARSEKAFRESVAQRPSVDLRIRSGINPAY